MRQCKPLSRRPPAQLQILETPEHEDTTERSKIVRMVATSDKFWERFSGAVGWGVIYSKGNESTQYSLNANTAYVRERWNAGASLDSNLSSSTEASATTRNSVALTAFHLLPPKNWLYGGVGAFCKARNRTSRCRRYWAAEWDGI